MARLSGGVGVIKVGAFTETEMKAKKFKIEDALNATKRQWKRELWPAAARLWQKLPQSWKNQETANFRKPNGWRYDMSATPWRLRFRQIAENSGVEPSGIITFIQTKGTHAGYDFTNYGDVNWADGKEEDMMKAGICRPA